MAVAENLNVLLDGESRLQHLEFFGGSRWKKEREMRSLQAEERMD
jgi:hypothetical protein